MHPQAFIFFGSSGSGKGTQAKLLTEYLKETTNRGTLYIETGEKFREFKEKENLTSLLVKDIMDHGKLIPEFLPIWIWTDFIIKHFSGNEHLILDGLCRRVDEAPVLTSALKFYGFKNPCVIFLGLTEKVAYERMKGRQRKDDTDEYINSRLAWFQKEVIPAMNYLKNNSYYTFLDINGEQSIEDVHNEIISKIVMPE